MGSGRPLPIAPYLPGMANTSDLNEGPVWRALARVSGPMVLGILGVLSVGIADSYFLARVGQTELTAVGFVYPTLVAITSLSIGLSAGANTVVSQSLGRKDTRRNTRRLSLHAIGLGVLAAGMTALAFHLFGPALFRLMGAEGAVLDAIRAFLPWWCLSFPFLGAFMVTNAVFRSGGNGRIPAAAMVLVALLNIGLDPLLIFGWGPIPAMGMEGAALATGIARILSAIAMLLLALRMGLVSLDCAPLSGLGDSLRRIGRVAVPAALSNAINPAGMAVVTAAVAMIGDAAVAGFGAATRIQSLAIVPLLALSSGIGPVVGQAWGAGDEARARNAVRLTFLICLAYGLAAATALTLFATPLARVITDGAEAQGFTATYIAAVSWSFAGYGILVTANAAMNARDRAVWSALLSLARIAVIYIPLAYLGGTLFSYPGILGAAVAANIVAIWGALVACRAVGLLELSFPPITGPAARLRRFA